MKIPHRIAIGLLFAVLALVAAACEQGPVAPVDELLTEDQETELALAVLEDELATEAALAMAEVSADAAARAGEGTAAQAEAGRFAGQARERFQAAREALARGDRTEAARRAREARQLVARAMEQAGSTEGLRAAVGRIDDLEDQVEADPEAYDDADALRGELSLLRIAARVRLERGEVREAAAAAVLAEQRHRFRYRWRELDPETRSRRAALQVELAGTAVGLATRLLESADDLERVQVRLLALAEEQWAHARRALEAGYEGRAVHLAQLARWSALKAVVLPEPTLEEARELHQVAVTLLGQAREAVGEEPTEVQSALLTRAARLLELGESKLEAGILRGIIALWDSAVISAWLLG